MKKLLFLMLALTAIMLALVSCGSKEGEGGDKPENNGQGEANEPENLIYNSTSELYLVYDSERMSEEQFNKIMDLFFTHEIYIKPGDKNGEPKAHEIIIGDTGRPASNQAYIQLDRIDKNSDNDLRYVAYSDGSSLAFAFDEDREGYCFEALLKCIEENYIKPELVLSKGVYNSTSFDLYDFLEEKDSAYYQERWTKISQLAGKYGPELVSALQALYSLYDGEKLIAWVANLYDPDICVCRALLGEDECHGEAICGSGGFYYSNSARDNYGYLPDAESTVQALGFLTDSGICAGIGGNYTYLVPDWMGEQIVDFIYNLQDPDGYFYHPQWGKSIGVSRRARDYNWCKQILNAYGSDTKYPTLGDIEIEEISSSNLTGRFGSSSVTAVSKVVLVESETLIPDHLKSVEAFKAYLIGLDIPNNSYSAGNELSSQGSQIRARGQAYCDVLIEHLNACQYENGTWHHTVNYTAVNGVMKISGVYSGMKAEIPRADKACKAAFEAISSDEETGGIAGIWNTWEAVLRILANIGTYASGGAETVAAIREEILASAPSAILATRDKLLPYLREDGSISYRKTGNQPTSQGAPVAVPDTSEGDLNGMVLGATYMIKSIFGCLDMNSYRVTICRTKERAMFLDIVNNLSPVNKGGSFVTTEDPIDFEYDNIGDTPTDVEIGSGASGVIVVDPRGEGNALEYIGAANAEKNNYIKIVNSTSSTGARRQVFEGELCFEENIPSNDSIRIEMGREGDDKNCYRILFRQGSDGRIELWESSASSSTNAMTNYLGVSVAVDEWFKIRIEYYKGDSSNVRIKVYFNDKLCAVSDNFYDPNGKKLTGAGTPLSDFRHTRIYSLNGKNVVLLLDNLYSGVSNDPYVYEELDEDYASNPYAINVDKIYEKPYVYDFEDAEDGVHDRLTVNKVGAAEILEDGENKALSLSGGSNIYVPVTKITRDANCSVFSVKIDAGECAVGDIAKLALCERNAQSRAIITVTLFVADEDGVRYVYAKDSNGKTIAGVKFPAEENTEFRVDFYEDKGVALLYVNGQVSGLTATLGADAKKLEYAKASVTAICSEALIVDEISTERSTKDYSAATTPKYDGKTYDFEKGLDGVEISGGVTLGGDAADRALSFNSAKNGYAKIPVTNRDDVVSMSAFSFDILFNVMNKAGATHEIAIVDADGSVIISFVIRIADGVAGIYEKTVLGMHSKPIATFDCKNETNLKFEYYEIDEVCKVYVDKVCLSDTPLVYSAENAKLTPAYATITSMGTASTALVDNISLDRTNSLFTASKFEKPESDSELVTFDYASGSSFSDKITYSINSAANDPTVVEVNKNSNADKALKFETLAGSAMDYVTVALTGGVANPQSTVFETELMIESSSSSNPYQIWFNSGGKSGMQLNITVSGGKILFYHGKVSDSSKKFDTGYKLGDWMKLRVENYFVNGQIIGKVFINDELKYTVKYYSNEGAVWADMYVDGELVVSAKTDNGETLVSSLTNVQIKALKATVATSYIDNVSLTGSDKSYAP